MRVSVCFVLAALILLASVPLVQAVPPLITYQGVLIDDGGPVTTTTNVVFAIWNDPTAGDSLWSELQVITPDANGLFTTQLGSVSPIPDSAFAGDAYISIQAGSDPEMSPRSQLTASPYAMRVQTIEGASGGGLSGQIVIGPGGGGSKSAAASSGELIVLGNASDTVRIAPGDSLIIRATAVDGSEVFIVKTDPNGPIMKIRDPGGGYMDVGASRVTAYDSNGDPRVEMRADVDGGVVSFFASTQSAKNGQIPGERLVEVREGGVIFFESNETDTNLSLFPNGDIQSKGQIAVGENSTGGSEATVFGFNNTASGDSAVVSGGYNNTASGFVSVVSGGRLNTANADYATVGGGFDNTASGDFSVVAGGGFNKARGSFSFIGGGGTFGVTPTDSNLAFGDYSVVTGGRRNIAEGENSVVGGGANNRATGDGSVIAGGGSAVTLDSNVASGQFAFIGGGARNIASATRAIVCGGFKNTASGFSAIVCGGDANISSGSRSTVGGGVSDTASGNYSTVSGGIDNSASGGSSAIGGGSNNKASGSSSTISGGSDNAAIASSSTVSGGSSNAANGTASVVVCGTSNIASGHSSAVGGGNKNIADGDYATVPGGRNASALGDYATAIGSQSKANHDGSVVITANSSGSTSDSITTSGVEQMVLRADGHFYLTDGSGSASIAAGDFLNTSTGAHLTTGGTWTNSSDANRKENFEAVDREALLEKIVALNISEWNYKAEDDDVRHIGPTAQDFHAIFGVGGDNKSISTIDPAGIALAAIQELDRRVKFGLKRDAEIETLREQVQELTNQIAILSESMSNSGKLAR